MVSARNANGACLPNISSLRPTIVRSRLMLNRIAAWWHALWGKAVELRQRMFDNDDWPDDWGLGV